MRPIFLIVLLMVVCKGCNKSFNKDHGIKRHRVSCKPAKQITAELFQKQQELQKSLNKTRSHCQRISSNADVPHTVPEMVSVGNSSNFRIDPFVQSDGTIAGDNMIIDDAMNEPEPIRDVTPEFQPPPTTSGHQRRFPRRYQDFLPSSTTNIPHLPPKQVLQPPSHSDPQSPNTRSPSPPPQPNVIKTDRDEFGLYRLYTSYPHTNPDEMQDLESRCDAPGLATASRNGGKRWWTGFGHLMLDLPIQKDGFFVPFLNATVFRLMNWFYSGSSFKSIAELQSLVDDVILAPDFKISDLDGFNAKRELRRLDGEAETNSNNSPSTPFANTNRWKQSSVYIRLPCEKVLQKEDTAPTLEVPGVYHRSLIEVITMALQDAAAKTFHFTPFSLFWQQFSESTPERVYSEIYNSDSFLEEDEKVKKLPPEPGHQYEHAIAALMVASDSTHLGQFGAAALWPIYTFFGNQSKYDRVKPTQFAAHHTAYIPSVTQPFLTAIVVLKFHL